MSELWEVWYWRPGQTGVGRGEFPRYVFEEAGVPYKNVGEDVDFLRKQIIEGELAGIPHFAPPLIKKGDFTLSQAHVTCRYLGELFGLVPDSEEDKLHAEQLSLTCHDYVAEGRLAFHGKHHLASYFDQMEETKPYIERFKETRFPRWMKYFERALKFNNDGKGFLVGDKCTYADLALLYVVRVTAAQFAESWAGADYIPCLKAWKARMEARPRLAAYFKSDRCRPFSDNSLM